MGALTEILFTLSRPSNLGWLSLIALLGWLAYNYFTRIRYPANLPLFGEPEGATSFSWKTRMRYYTDCQNMFREAYEQYGKHGKTVLIPGVGIRCEIILANTSLPWIVAQPDSVLSNWAGFVDLDQVQHTMWNSEFVKDPWQGSVVKRDLEKMVNPLEDELKYALETRLGTEKQWKDVPLYRVIQKVAAQANNRFTVGLPLCRDEPYLDQNIAFPEIFFAVGGAATGLPRILRPFLGPILGLPLRFKLWQLKNSFRECYNQRMKFLQSDNPKAEEPQDHLQMMFRFAQTDRPKELNLTDMTLRLAMANFGSFHQTSIAITHLILEVIASDKEYNTIALLREETAAILKEAGGVWSKATPTKMIRADSVCRESLRLNAFANRQIIRQVMVSGLVTEDGIELPKGGIVSVLAQPSQCDGDVFDQAMKFDPWRFSRAREANVPGSEKSSLVQLGPTNLPFGLGRHACPGRFLVDFELKMILAYLLENYDLELHPDDEGTKPKGYWIAEAHFPPEKAMIRVKRRETFEKA